MSVLGATRLFAAIFWAPAPCASSPVCDYSGTQESAETITIRELANPIEINLQSSPLSAVLEDLRRQTGVAIEAAQYLRDRRVSVWFSRASAESFLNEPADLVGAKWKVTGPKQGLMYRPQPPKPRSIRDAIRNLFLALPSEYQRFLTSGPTLPDDPASKLQRELAPSGELNQLFFAIDTKINQLARSEHDAFVRAPPQTSNENCLAFAALTREQREQIVFMLTMQALLSNPAISRGWISEFQEHPTRAALKFRWADGNILITGPGGAISVTLGKKRAQ